MIAKISRGASVRGLANYLHGPGKANEHVYEGVVGGCVIGGTLGAEGALDGSRWAVDMATVMGQRPEVAKPVWHMSLRLPVGDRVLSDGEWRDVAQGMGEAMGWAASPWVMVRHGADHVHVVVSRVGWGGELWHGRNDYTEAQKARQGVEQRLGLTQTRTEAQKACTGPLLTSGEYAKGLRTGRSPSREELGVVVRAAVDAAEGLGREVWEQVLEQQGIAYRANVASTGRVSGYSFAVPERDRPREEWVWFKASQLGKDLAWSKMQTRLDAPVPEPKIVVPERKPLESRRRHRERVEAARNQARAKAVARRRAQAPVVARSSVSRASQQHALLWRKRHAVSERTKVAKDRAELREAMRAREIARAAFPGPRRRGTSHSTQRASLGVSRRAGQTMQQAPTRSRGTGLSR